MDARTFCMGWDSGPPKNAKGDEFREKLGFGQEEITRAIFFLVFAKRSKFEDANISCAAT